MSNISLWEAMKTIERLHPQWKYQGNYGHGRLYFETTTLDGVVSALIEDGYYSGGEGRNFNDAMTLTIISNGLRIFYGNYRVEYKARWWEGNPKPYYSQEYIYLKNYIKSYEAKEQAKYEEEKRKEQEKKGAEELRIQTERDNFFGR